MKVLIVFGLCVLFGVVVATREQDDLERNERNNRRRLQAMVVRVVGDRDREQNSDRYQEDREDKDDRHENNQDRVDNDDGNYQLKANQLNTLARRLDTVSKMYGNHGKLRVTYIAPQHRGANRGNLDLGGLNFQYIPQNEYIFDLSPYTTGLFHRQDRNYNGLNLNPRVDRNYNGLNLNPRVDLQRNNEVVARPQLGNVLG